MLSLVGWLPLQVGDEKRVIKGLDEGIRGMKTGGTRRIVVPPQVNFPVFKDRFVSCRAVCFVCSGLVWFDLVRFGVVCFVLVWFGLVWFGLIWFDLVWFGLVWFGVV